MHQQTDSLQIQILVHCGMVFHSVMTVLRLKHWKDSVQDSMLVQPMF
jgi:hypothetical protein